MQRYFKVKQILEGAARRHADKLIQEKTGKGYVEAK
jgi:predicted DNA-binding WGR domain protein